MKTKIFTLLGLVLLCFSCQNELLDLQEGALQSAAMSSSSNNCEPDLVGLESSLPDTVTATAKLPECIEGEGSFAALDIDSGYLAGMDTPAWCADLQGSLSAGSFTFDVYSSYEDVSDLELSPGVPLFENPDNFDKINWLLNQDIIGTDSPNSGTYTFGHLQWAIWELIENGINCTDDCDFLSCVPFGQWYDDPDDNVRLGLELVTAAEAGEGFVPQCGQQIAVILASTTVQSLIITIDVPEKEVECYECEGKVTNLKLQYNGTEKADIIVKTKKEDEDGSKIVFERLMVMPGDTFSFTGNDKKGTLGTEITIYVNDEVNTKIHTSCSEPIGPGLVSGDFEVISGSSREGGNLCPVETPPGGGDDCNECDGKVTRLDLQYNGADKTIEIVQKKDGTLGTPLFSGPVSAGDEFTIYGQDDKGTLSTEIIITDANGTEIQRIHTSCSDPIGAGAVFGDFTVMGGASREGGELCPVDTPPGGGDDCNECEGKVTRLDLQYNGADKTIEIVQKKDGTLGTPLFSGPVSAGDEFTIYGQDDKGTLSTEIIITDAYGTEIQRIHTSCSVDILAGSVFGYFKVLGGSSRNGGEFCKDTSGPSF